MAEREPTHRTEGGPDWRPLGPKHDHPDDRDRAHAATGGHDEAEGPRPSWKPKGTEGA
jgi:hypothetical protein